MFLINKPVIPNVFTPNNDLRNDVLTIQNIEKWRSKRFVSIHNRWGVKVFETDMYDNAEAWDGRDMSGSDVPDGEILVNAINGRGPFTYSIDGGGTFQDEPLFQQLLPDTFPVVVRDSLNCGVREDVIVDFTTSVRNTVVGNTLKVFPNPSAEVFTIELRGLSDVVVVPFEVIDATGRVVLRDNAGSYNDVVRASFSLKAFPSGNYYVRVLHPDMEELVPIIKSGN